jgi:ribonuclease P/MRP protein subunit POP5
VKHLPKHLRPRWRYLAVVLESRPDADIEEADLQRCLRYSAQNLLGDTGSAELDLTVIRFHHGDGSGGAIVRTRRETVDRARSVIACVDEIDGDAVGVRVAGVSGTIRACEEKYMGHGPENQAQRYVAFDGAQRSATVRDGRIDVQTDDAYVGATTLDI